MHEALLRMADFDGAMIAAAHLMPIAEKLGLVRLIDRNVVQLAVGVLLDYPAGASRPQCFGDHRHRSALVWPAHRNAGGASRTLPAG